MGREIDDEDDVTDEETLEASFETRIVEHQQSPIDVRRSMARATCFEYHQIRHKKGDFDIRDAKVLKQILPNKLRLVYPQEYNEKIWSDGVGGPSADMPKVSNSHFRICVLHFICSNGTLWMCLIRIASLNTHVTRHLLFFNFSVIYRGGGISFPPHMWTLKYQANIVSMHTLTP